MKKLFKIIRVKDKAFYQSIASGGAEDFITSDPFAAARIADRLTADYGEKWQPRSVATDENWKEREAARFRDGTYYPCPWDSEPWWHGSGPDKEHFAHVAIEKSSMVAFTKDEEAGMADRQKRMSPGGYLTEYFGDVLTGQQIRAWSAEFSIQFDPAQLKFAKSAEEISHVYQNGPDSCMSAGIHKYSSNKKHPSVAYAGPDLAVAYLEDNDRILARSVVWPEKKIYVRFYGDVERLRAALERQGYKQGDLSGARMARIPFVVEGKSKRFVFPYLDRNNFVTDDGEYLVVDDETQAMSARGTSGYCYDDRPTCTVCKTKSRGMKSYLKYDEAFGERVNSACESCLLKAGYTAVDPDTGYWTREQDMASWGGENHRKHWWDNNIVYSTVENIPLFTFEAKTLGNGEVVSNTWFRTQGTYCPDCGHAVRRAGGDPESHHSGCSSKGVKPKREQKTTPVAANTGPTGRSYKAEFLAKQKFNVDLDQAMRQLEAAQAVLASRGRRGR